MPISTSLNYMSKSRAIESYVSPNVILGQDNPRFDENEMISKRNCRPNHENLAELLFRHILPFRGHYLFELFELVVIPSPGVLLSVENCKLGIK